MPELTLMFLIVVAALTAAFVAMFHVIERSPHLSRLQMAVNKQINALSRRSR